MNDRSNSTSDNPTAGDRSTSFAVTFELLFHKQIQQLGLKFGNSNNLVQTVQELSDEISKVLNSERVTFYQFDPKQNLLIGQLLLTGGQTRELKLAPEPKSIAGYVAMTKRTVNIHNVYDDAELKKLNAEPDILINNAGMSHSGASALELLDSDIPSQLMALNLTAPALLGRPPLKPAWRAGAWP